MVPGSGDPGPIQYNTGYHSLASSTIAELVRGVCVIVSVGVCEFVMLTIVVVSASKLELGC